MGAKFKKFLLFLKIFSIRNDWAIFLLVIGGVIMSFLELAGLGLLFPFIVIVQNPASALNHRSLNFIYHHFQMTDPKSIVIFLGVLLAGVFILKNAFYILYLKYEFRTLSRWKMKIANMFFNAYVNTSYENYLSKNSSDLIGTITGATNYVLVNFVHTTITLFNLSLSTIIIVGFIVFSFPGGSVAIIPIAGLILWTHSFMLKRAVKGVGEKSVTLSSKQYGVLQQSLKGFKETRIHQKSHYFSSRFATLHQQLAQVEEKGVFLQNLPSASVELIVMSLLIVTFVVLMYMSHQAEYTFALMSAIAFASIRLIPTMNRMINSITAMNSAQGPLDKLIEEAYTLGIAHNDIKPAVKTVATVVPFSFDDTLQFKDVSYQYPASDKVNLTDVNLTIKRGEFVGVTGPSGGGKTTLVSLLLGFLHPTAGSYTIDGEVITKENVQRLFPLLSYVDQNVFILNDTIAENIAYGEEKEDIDRDRVMEALKQAQLWDFVEKLDLGIETIVGEEGKLLSGGQRQRIAIARAFYKKADILVLDEASAPLDVETERQLFDFLYSLKGKLTVIMIAHRLSTLKSCDKILFMDQCRIADQGSLAELQKKNETFRRYLEYSNISDAEMSTE